MVVEDDSEMRGYYVRFFERLADSGYSAVVVEDGEKALDVLQREPVDILLLDWNLPGISGEALLRAVRANPMTRSAGVLMVTGRCAPEDEITALDSGADDHLAKPFAENELLARLLSLSRRRDLEIGRHEANRYPGLEFDLDTDLVRIDGRRVRLTSKEMGVLALFLRRPNWVYTNADLWETLWGYESESWEYVLAVTISALRRKLGPDWGGRIQVHKGKGYEFVCPNA